MRAALGRRSGRTGPLIGRRGDLRNLLTFGVVALGPLLAVITFTVLGPAELDEPTSGLRIVLLVDLVYILVVATLVLNRIARIVAARRARSAGSRLHLRLTWIFALVALVPTVLVAVFSAMTLNVGLEGWFSDRVQKVIGASLAAAEAYQQEQSDDLITDAEALAGLLNAQRSVVFMMSDGDFRQVLAEGQSRIQRGVKEAYIIDGIGDIRARGERSYLFGYERPTAEDLDRARAIGTLVIRDWENDEFRALVHLSAFADRYLLLSRAVNGDLLNLLDDTQQTASFYQRLERERGRMLFEFGLLYLGFALILILAAIWLGLWLAERLSRPIGRLASAAERVGAGDLGVQVREERGDDEIATLGKVFNQMTRQLKRQHETLLDSNRKIEERRRLFDSVLGSVTAGVMGLDVAGRVDFINRSGARLLSLGEAPVAGRALSDLVPEFAPLLATLTASREEAVQQEIKLRRGGVQDILLVRAAMRRASDGAPEGIVMAFDDVTDLVSAQRMAAWGDVARRIAHEIKNPLTPIQLSAERITRKFGRKLEAEDAGQLQSLTGVIVRQTGDLRRIVDEFSKFARMPQPEQTLQDLGRLVSDAVTLQAAGSPEARVVADLPEGAVQAMLDPTLIGQALTNLIKNALEATDSFAASGHAPQGYLREVRVALTEEADEAVIRVADNGGGFPEDRARLFEPYVTTRDGGTGLGLSIVKKIVEEHGGRMRLEDAPAFDGAAHSGAQVMIVLPRVEGNPAGMAEDESEGRGAEA
ncbi:MAG: ATP-binding protein [Qingshengfaniella sp.]